MPDMHNLCKFAHSQAELDEWTERWQWRQMKKEIAKKDKVYSYMEELLEDFKDAQSGVTVVSVISLIGIHNAHNDCCD